MTQPPKKAASESSTKSRKPDPGQQVAALEAEIARVRDREEQRLLVAARKAGYFRRRLTAPQLVEMFRDTIERASPPLSSFARLTDRLSGIRKRAQKAGRTEKARRKVILGGFLVAQFRHKPDLFDGFRSDIEAHIAGHPSAATAARNSAFMEGFLDTLASGSAPPGEAGITREQARRDRTRRQIMLGAWALDRRAALPGLDALIRDELDGFLGTEQQPAQKRALLADVLKA